MLKVGFYLRELNFRGIANTIYIYAKNNQEILKNKSIIFYNSTSLDNQTEAIKEFKKKFKINTNLIYNPLNKKEILKKSNFKIKNKIFKKGFLKIINIARELITINKLALVNDKSIAPTFISGPIL